MGKELVLFFKCVRGNRTLTHEHSNMESQSHAHAPKTLLHTADERKPKE